MHAVHASAWSVALGVMGAQITAESDNETASGPAFNGAGLAGAVFLKPARMFLYGAIGAVGH